MNNTKNMKWISDDYFSEYYYTWEGQLEYWLMQIFYGAMTKYTRLFPPFWCGAWNEMALYLNHPSYSPFVDHPRLPKKMSLQWCMSNVPEGQEHLVDENFLPRSIPMKIRRP